MQQWDEQAQEYAQGFLTRTHILYPFIVKKLLPELFQIPGWSFLDIGCGNGDYTVAALNAGAGLVVGIDSSADQIAQAVLAYRDAITHSDGKISFKHVAMADYTTDRKFDIMLANMVLCNISTVEALRAFLKSAFECAGEASKLCISNVGPSYQKTGRWVGVEHVYPTETPQSGQEFKVTLFRADGTSIGPFTNYYWKQKDLYTIAYECGWAFAGVEAMKAVPADGHCYLPAGEWPEYRMYYFHCTN